MARRPRERRRSDDCRQLHHGTEERRRRRRRLHVLANDCDRGFSVYALNVDHFDSDDDDMDSRARRSRRIVRLAGKSAQRFVAVGTRIFDLYPSSSDRPSIVFDTRTRLVATPPPFQTPKEFAAFWAVGRAVYALECRLGFRGRTRHGCFERLGREPRPGHGKWEWEALPSPPFEPNVVVSHAVHPDGATVFLSVHRAGTFSFDADRLAWARHGGWLLPFDGKAHYVGELGAWVGISSRVVGHIAACPVPDGCCHDDDEAAAVAEPACKYGKDLLFSKKLERHLDANLTYMGGAEFCLQETLTTEGETMASTFGLMVRMLLRVVTFRVEYSADGELCAVNRRAIIYKLPHHSSERRPFAFWI
ncbi:unnamed protein product [Urochloa decumbens]|uniref:Uncharacterized protein n=1 Tax=Urochloa decumbens TaxID=240449 RepID=A0ABC9G4U2_9POAL